MVELASNAVCRSSMRTAAAENPFRWFVAPGVIHAIGTGAFVRRRRLKSFSDVLGATMTAFHFGARTPKRDGRIASGALASGSLLNVLPVSNSNDRRIRLL